jgi:hypothetical protein
MSKLIDVNKIDWQEGVFVNPNTKEPLPIIHKMATIEMLRDWQEGVQAIPIPKRATNGDMIKAMFPDYTTYEFAIEDSLKIATMFVIPETSQVFYVHFDLDWWNAPYSKEGEKEDE